MFRPAVESLLAQGKRPRLAGIWWMQGCADQNRDKAYYKESLQRLIERCRNELGFENGRIYIGHVVKPGESAVNPSGSVGFSQNVRDAQDETAAAIDRVEIIDTKDCAMQYESNFSGYIHFSHAGVNRIGEILAEKVIADGPSGWNLFSTPGKWEMSDGKAVFVPSVGNPEISYSQEGSVITASISYPGWTEYKSFDMAEAGVPSPGYLELNGKDRFMRIEKSSDFDIAKGGSQTVTLDVMLETGSGELQSLIGNRFRRLQNGNNNDVSGFEIYNMTTYNATAHAYPSTSWSAANINASRTMTAGKWAHLALVHDGAAGQIRYYIDGVQKGSVATKNLALPCYADILVGCRYNMKDNTVSSLADIGGFANARIDNVRIYSSALSAAQVALDSDSETPLEDAGVIAAYDFSRISESNVTDISGNGHTGYLVGSWPDYSVPFYAVTVSETENGSLSLFDGDKEISSGDMVEENTILTVVAMPDADCELIAVKVNGETLEGNTFSVTENVTVDAEFKSKYTAPSGSTYQSNYLTSIATSGAEKNIGVTYSAHPGIYTIIGDTVTVAPATRFSLNLVANSVGAASSTTVHEDLRFCQAYIFADWEGSGEFSLVNTFGLHAPSGNSPHSNMHIYGNYDDVMDISQTLQVPDGVRPGTVARIRVVYQNAWTNLGATTTPDPNAANIDKGLAYDIKVNVAEKHTFTVIANVTGGEATVEVGGSGGFVEIPAEGLRVGKGSELDVRFTRASSDHILTAFDVNGVDDMDHMTSLSQTIYSIPAIDRDYTFDVLYSLPQFTLTVVNLKGVDPEACYYGEFRDNQNRPIDPTGQNSVTVDKGSTVYFTIMAPRVESGYTFKGLTDNADDVTDELIPFGDDLMYFLSDISEDHILILDQSYAGILVVGNDAAGSLSYSNGILSVSGADALIELYDINGRLLRRADAATMPICDLAGGVYVAKATRPGATYTLKFIKF